MEPEPLPGPPEASPSRPDAASPSGSASPWTVLAVAIAAGLAAWLVGESPYVIKPPEAVKTDVMGYAVVSQTAESARAAYRMSAVRYFGLTAAVLSIAMAAMTFKRRRGSLTVTGVVVLLGSAACGVLAGLAWPLFEYGHAKGLSDMVDSLIAHLAVWLPTGALIGLVLGLTDGGLRRAVGPALSGAAGAALGVVLYELVAGIVFPTGGADLPMPAATIHRLAAMLLIFTPAALIAVRAIREAAGRTTETRSTA